jgi:hypothetical protein
MPQPTSRHLSPVRQRGARGASGGVQSATCASRSIISRWQQQQQQQQTILERAWLEAQTQCQIVLVAADGLVVRLVLEAVRKVKRCAPACGTGAAVTGDACVCVQEGACSATVDSGCQDVLHSPYS